MWGTLVLERDMNIDDISLIEKTLSVIVPSWYQEFLKNVPKWIIDEDEEGDQIYYSAIYSKPDVIIRATKEAREFKEDDWENEFSSDLICIGFTDSHFCIRSNQKEKNIYTFDPYEGHIEPGDGILLEELIENLRYEYGEDT